MPSTQSNATENIMRLLNGLVDRLLDPLSDLPAGAHVVQLACGTGGLSAALAQRRPDLKVTGIDIDSRVIENARTQKASDLDFRVMDMTRLDFGDATVDAVISRIGLLSPGTSGFERQAREAVRILRPGGVLSMATWTDVDESPYTRIGLAVLRRLGVPVPDFGPVFAPSARGEDHLAAAGLTDLQASWFDWDTEYPSFDDWWQFDTGFGPLKALFETVEEDSARALMKDELAEFALASGGYRLPARVRVITAHRRP